MAQKEFIESKQVYFDYKNWGFRTYRKRINATSVEMSHPCDYWNDAITTIVIEEVSEKKFNDMVFVPSPKSFILCKWTPFSKNAGCGDEGYSDGAYKILPLRRVVGQYILIASAMKEDFDED